MAKTKEILTRKKTIVTASVELEDRFIFPQFIEDCGYTRTQISYIDGVTPEQMLLEPNSDGKVYDGEKLVGEIAWVSNGWLVLAIINHEPAVMFLNSRCFRKSVKIVGDNKNTIPHMDHAGTRLIKRGIPSHNSAYKVVATYDAFGKSNSGNEYDFLQFGIDETTDNVTYTNTHIIVGEDKFLISDIKKLYDDIFR